MSTAITQSYMEAVKIPYNGPILKLHELRRCVQFVQFEVGQGHSNWHTDAPTKSSDAPEDMIRQMQESYDLGHDSCYKDEVMLTVVVVGASGDLARKKIFPALFALYYQGLLPQHLQVVGYARSSISNDDFREKIYRTLGCRIDAGYAFCACSWGPHTPLLAACQPEPVIVPSTGGCHAHLHQRTMHGLRQSAGCRNSRALPDRLLVQGGL